jgi:DnaJ-domain-containing protein 1
VIKSYLNDEDGRIFGPSRRGDPDLEEAEAELESFLRGAGPRAETRDWSDSRANTGGAWGEGRATGRGSWTRAGDWSGGRANTGGAWSDAWADPGVRREKPAGPPEELRPDFAELGLPFGAGPEECKAAYRRLLKLHHPDRHAGHQGNMEKATKKMATINAAYGRIEAWRAGQKR